MIRSISHCLNPQLLEIYRRIAQLDELTHKVKQNLLPPLCNNCQVGSFNKGCLVVTTSNAAWATELRYSLPELRDKLRKAGVYQLTSIKIAIVDRGNPNSSKPRAKSSLSSEARNSIKTASELCSYPPLKAALLRLVE